MSKLTRYLPVDEFGRGMAPGTALRDWWEDERKPLAILVPMTHSPAVGFKNKSKALAWIGKTNAAYAKRFERVPEIRLAIV